MTTELPSVCPLDCPDTCSLTVTVEDDRVTKVRGTEVNPFTEGVLCNKVTHYFPDFVHGENRLRYPQKRVGAKGEGTFDRITWEEALDSADDLSPPRYDWTVKIEVPPIALPGVSTLS